MVYITIIYCRFEIYCSDTNFKIIFELWVIALLLDIKAAMMGSKTANISMHNFPLKYTETLNK